MAGYGTEDAYSSLVKFAVCEWERMGFVNILPVHYSYIKLLDINVYQGTLFCEEDVLNVYKDTPC